jgi:nitric oxide dioxygenase
MGDFFVDPSKEDQDHPLVLISAGVGLTSLMSILNTLSAQPAKRPISWIHAARSSSVRAFAEHVQELERKMDNIHSVLFTTNVKGSEVLGQGHHEGHITAAKLDKEKDLFLKEPKTQYYICGPIQFMQDMEVTLLQFGVDSSRIHMERFGTGGVPRATA